MNEKELIGNLQKIDALFKQNEIDTWIDAGTLLGAVRNKKFIPWDYDMDIGVWYEDVQKINNIEKDIQKLGFEICFFDYKDYIRILNKDCEIDINLYHHGNNVATRVWTVNNKFGELLDFFLWILNLKDPSLKKSEMPIKITETISRIFNNTPLKKIKKLLEELYKKIGCRYVKISIPNHYFENLTNIMFYDVNFKAPGHTEKYLEHRYGKDWKTPRKDYKFYRDDGAIIK